jgi:hypothetical protein
MCGFVLLNLEGLKKARRIDLINRAGSEIMTMKIAKSACYTGANQGL